MLDTIRAFAQERLDESDEAAVVRTKHLRFYRRLAGSIVRGVPGSDGAAVLHALEPEIDNVRAALTWSLSDDALAYDGLPLALGMIALWTVGHLWEGCEWLQRLLATGAGAESAARAWALHNLAQMLIYCGGFALALPAITDCIELSRRIERPDTLVHSLSLLALTQRGFGPAAVRSADEAVEVARKTGDPSLLLRALYTLGSVTFWQGDLERSREASAEAVVWGRKSLISVMTAAPLRELGNVAYRQGDYATAKRYCLESLTLLQTLGREPTMAQTLASLGRIALAEGDTEEAEFRFQEVLELARTTGSGHYLALALSGLAALAASQDAHLAVRRFAAAHALGERLLWPMGALYRDEHTALIARLRRELGDDAFDEEWRRGSATSIDEIVRGGLGAALNA
jgi:tetratricopeptide (TPR) repeat protein